MTAQSGTVYVGKRGLIGTISDRHADQREAGRLLYFYHYEYEDHEDSISREPFVKTSWELHGENVPSPGGWTNGVVSEPMHRSTPIPKGLMAGKTSFLVETSRVSSIVEVYREEPTSSRNLFGDDFTIESPAIDWVRAKELCEKRTDE